MRTALPTSSLVLTLFLFGLGISASVSLVGCRDTGKTISGSTYCDPVKGSALVPQASIPTGTCKGTATCIAFTAGRACADPSLDAGECEWACTCIDETWTCTSSCSGTCSSSADGPITPADDGGTVGDAGV